MISPVPALAQPAAVSAVVPPADGGGAGRVTARVILSAPHILQSAPRSILPALCDLLHISPDQIPAEEPPAEPRS